MKKMQKQTPGATVPSNDEVIEVDSFWKIDESGKIGLNNYIH